MSQTTFNTMVSEIPSAVANIDFSITKIDEQTTALQLQINDIKNYTLSPMVSASDDYLDTKAAEFTISLGTLFSPSATTTLYGSMTQWVSGGPTDNLTDWVITSGGPGFAWTPSDISSGSSGVDLDQYNRQLDYESTLEHIYREFNHEEFGSEDPLPIVTYGLQANKDGLLLGKNVLLKDKAKLQEMYDIYSDFVT